MNILGIETSTKNLSLAVARDSRVVVSRNKALRRPLSSSIMPGIENILKAAELPLESVDGFAVGLGPGSFTSLRVGLSTIKGLVFALAKPVVGVSSLDVLAMNVKGKGVQICALCDAKREMAYACLYEQSAGGLRRKGDYLLAGIQDILKGIKGPTVFVGDGVPIFQKEIQRARGLKPIFTEDKHSRPQAKHLIALALPRFTSGQTDNIERLTPLYLYPENCQVSQPVRSV